MSNPGTLERGAVCRRLILALATQEKNQVQLAAEFGVVQSSISEFATRHRDEITERRAHLDNELAGLWVADRYNRIAEMQADIEEISDSKDEKLLRVKHAAFRQIAEELGQLKTSIDVSGRLTYVVEGIDMSALR